MYYDPRNNRGHHARSNPYHIPRTSVDSNFGRFIDDETEIEFIMSRINSPEVPPLKKSESESEGIPNLPTVQKETNFKPVVIIQNKDADYQILDLGLMVTLDKTIRKVGIWVRF